MYRVEMLNVFFSLLFIYVPRTLLGWQFLCLSTCLVGRFVGCLLARAIVALYEWTHISHPFSNFHYNIIYYIYIVRCVFVWMYGYLCVCVSYADVFGLKWQIHCASMITLVKHSVIHLAVVKFLCFFLLSTNYLCFTTSLSLWLFFQPIPFGYMQSMLLVRFSLGNCVHSLPHNLDLNKTMNDVALH